MWRLVTVADVLVLAVLAANVLTLTVAAWWAMRWKGPWRIAAALPIVALAAWAVAVLTHWPTEHTLWPFELLVWGPVCLVYLVVIWFWRDSNQA